MCSNFLNHEKALSALDSYIENRNPKAKDFIKSDINDFKNLDIQTLRDISFYSAIKAILINIKNSNITADKINFKEELQISPVLTAHPTETLSDNVVKILMDIIEAEDSNLEFEKLLPKFFAEPLTPRKKLNVKEEVYRNLMWHEKARKISDEFTAENKNITINFRSWAGGDADGNYLVNHKAMRDAAKLHLQQSPQNPMEIDVRQNSYIHSLTVSEILEKIVKFLELKESKDTYEQELYNLLKSFPYIDYIISHDDPINDANQKDKKRCMLLDVLLSQSKVFEIIHKLGDIYTPAVSEELKRITVMKKYPQIFKTYIISNCEFFSDVLQLVFLLKTHDLNVQIVPLFESKNAIEAGEDILYKAFDNTHYQNALQDLTQKIMIGFSDSQKESGSMVLPLIEIALERIQKLCFDRGIQLKVFYGNGLDIGRGGPSIMRPEQTIQGNQIRYNFLNKNYAYSYFADVANCKVQRSAEMDRKDNVALLMGVEIATKEFKKLWDKQAYYYAIETYLEKASPFALFVRTNNFSSRPSKRNVSDDGENPYSGFFYSNDASIEVMQGIRAISWVNSIEGTFTNFNLWFGLLNGLRAIGDNAYIKRLYVSNDVFRDICNKALIGLELSDFETAWSYFPESERIKDAKEKEALAIICKQFLGKKEQDPKKFLCMLEVESNNLRALFKEIGISLNKEVIEKLHEKKTISYISNRMMAWLNKSIIFERKLISDVINNITEEQFFEIAGALYVAFSEFRMPINNYWL